MCVFALLLHPTHISFIGCAALVLEGPGQPRGQQVWPRCATVLERIKAGLPRSEEHAASHLNSCRTVAGASIV